MTELSLTILDIASNSKSAGATLIQIIIDCDTARDVMDIKILDNGRGMSKEQIERVTDPFYTTRTTRRVGMGLPLFKMLCQQCQGSLTITARKTGGIEVFARLSLSSIDRPPLGDMGATISTLLLDSHNTDYIFTYLLNGKKYVFSTIELKQVLGESEVDNSLLAYINGMINENIQIINGGKVL